jgi:hypothetical protein
VSAVVAFFLLASGWRLSTISPLSSGLRIPHKRLRRAPSELPETFLSRIRKRDSTPEGRNRARDEAAREAKQVASSVSSSPTVRARISSWLARPRYLQAYGNRDFHGTLAPPTV